MQAARLQKERQRDRGTERRREEIVSLSLRLSVSPSLCPPVSLFQYPPSYRLVIVEWARNCFMCLHIFEPRALKSSVRSDIERIRLTEKPLQIEGLKIDLDRFFDAFCSVSNLTLVWIHDVQMHESFLAKDDPVGG